MIKQRASFSAVLKLVVQLEGVEVDTAHFVQNLPLLFPILRSLRLDGSCLYYGDSIRFPETLRRFSVFEATETLLSRLPSSLTTLKIRQPLDCTFTCPLNSTNTYIPSTIVEDLLPVKNLTRLQSLHVFHVTEEDTVESDEFVPFFVNWTLEYLPTVTKLQYLRLGDFNPLLYAEVSDEEIQLLKAVLKPTPQAFYGLIFRDNFINRPMFLYKECGMDPLQRSWINSQYHNWFTWILVSEVMEFNQNFSPESLFDEIFIPLIDKLALEQFNLKHRSDGIDKGAEWSAEQRAELVKIKQTLVIEHLVFGQAGKFTQYLDWPTQASMWLFNNASKYYFDLHFNIDGETLLNSPRTMEGFDLIKAIGGPEVNSAFMKARRTCWE